MKVANVAATSANTEDAAQSPIAPFPDARGMCR